MRSSRTHGIGRSLRGAHPPAQAGNEAGSEFYLQCELYLQWWEIIQRARTGHGLAVGFFGSPLRKVPVR